MKTSSVFTWKDRNRRNGLKVKRFKILLKHFQKSDIDCQTSVQSKTAGSPLLSHPGKLIQNFFPKFQFSGVWHRRISGKLIQYYFEISISEAWAGPITEKFIHKFFVSTHSVMVKYRDMSRTDLKPEIGLCHATRFTPQNSKIDFWMSFPEIGLAHSPEIRN